MNKFFLYIYILIYYIPTDIYVCILDKLMYYTVTQRKRFYLLYDLFNAQRFFRISLCLLANWKSRKQRFVHSIHIGMSDTTNGMKKKVVVYLKMFIQHDSQCENINVRKNKTNNINLKCNNC